MLIYIRVENTQKECASTPPLLGRGGQIAGKILSDEKINTILETKKKETSGKKMDLSKPKIPKFAKIEKKIEFL